MIVSETSSATPQPPANLAHPFLAGMSPAALKIIADNSMRVEYRPGEIIFHQGDPANRFYLIDSGSVSLEAVRNGSGLKQIDVIGGGDVLGWSWLFPPYEWQFSARALAPTKATFIYGSRLRELCETDHDLGFELMKRVSAVIIRRLQATRRQLLAREKLAQ